MPPQSTTADPPVYKSHPLYSLRRLILINALIGIPLAAISGASSPYSYSAGVWIFAGLALIASGLLALADLCIWAHLKHKEDVLRHQRQQGVCRICSERVDGGENGDNPFVARAAISSPDLLANMTVRSDDGDDDIPKWPLRWIMILDFLLTGALFWQLLSEMSVAWDPWYGGPSGGSFLMCYATIPMGFAVILHARCWWRQYRAREREAWVRSLNTSMSIGEVRRVEDAENGVERLVHPLSHTQSHDHGQNMDARFKGHVAYGRGSMNETPSGAQERSGRVGSVRVKMEGLNREVTEALTSKSWLPEASNIGERQSLLPRNGYAHADNVSYLSDSSGKCACPQPRTCRTVGSGKRLIAHVHTNGPVDQVSNNNVNRDLTCEPQAKSIVVDRKATCVTPSGSSFDSASLIETSTSSHKYGGYVDEGMRGVVEGIDVKEDRIATSSTLLTHGDNPLGASDKNCDQDDNEDADIMVVKKGKKKGKGKSTSGEEKRRREPGLGE